MKRSNNETLRGIFKRSMKLLLKKHKIFWIFVLICNIFMALLPTASLITMQKVINLIHINSSNISLIMICVLIYIFIDILNAIILSFYNYYYSKVSLQINRDLTVLLLDKAAALELHHFEDSDTYNIIDRAQKQGNGQILNFVSASFEILRLLITTLSYIIILCQFNFSIILLAIVFPITSHLFNLHLNKMQYNIQKKRTNEERKAWYINYIVTMGKAFKEIRLFGMYDYLKSKYVSIMDDIIKQDVAISKRMYIVLGVLNFFDQVLSGVIFAYIIFRGVLGFILIGDVVTYTKCVFSSKSNFAALLSQINNMSKTSLFLTFFFDFLDLEINSKPDKGITINDIYKIELKHIFYKYNNTNVLTDINLTIKRGELITLIGKNGSGKTTLIKIIMGFYSDYSGEIYINDINLKQISKSSYMQKIGCLFQDFMQYEATVRENIGYGDLNCINDDRKINSLIQMTNLEHVLDNANGLDMGLGYWLDGGRQLSVGEWQRVAISRCFARNADFYVLDEPNASLDSESENKILNYYKRLLNEKMGILITHRLNNLAIFSNKIYVLSNGLIVEEGTHEQLINLVGEYHALYSIQFGNISKHPPPNNL